MATVTIDGKPWIILGADGVDRTLASILNGNLWIKAQRHIDGEWKTCMDEGAYLDPSEIQALREMLAPVHRNLRPDRDLDCSHCHTYAPRRFQPAPEAERRWYCSECGAPYPGEGD